MTSTNNTRTHQKHKYIKMHKYIKIPKPHTKYTINITMQHNTQKYRCYTKYTQHKNTIYIHTQNTINTHAR